MPRQPLLSNVAITVREWFCAVYRGYVASVSFKLKRWWASIKRTYGLAIFKLPTRTRSWILQSTSSTIIQKQVFRAIMLKVWNAEVFYVVVDAFKDYSNSNIHYSGIICNMGKSFPISKEAAPQAKSWVYFFISRPPPHRDIITSFLAISKPGKFLVVLRKTSKSGEI